ncbi:hypothetical protein Cgig2_002113 [Carnegiea gigantea]|uniref:Uncharacterized protein n=1 Tax=Carnegiea gigantea TaxID=171969 RepID=A0A9Q1KVQ6_9CARY|nr:hypothetical protein Cgig2_002113 [Carnegiea gigantea]
MVLLWSKFVGGHKLDVDWARFQKRPARRLSDQRKAAKKKIIPKKNSGTMPNVASKNVEDEDIQVASKLKNDLIQDASIPYKQALLSCPNDNNLEAGRSANEVAEEAVYEGLSDNSKTITQPLDNALNRPIYCGSSMEDGEEIDSNLRTFDGPLELELQLHEKSERCKPSNRGKKSDNKNIKSNHKSPTPTKIAKEALDFRKRLGISVTGNEALAIRRIARSLRKELENNQQSKG